jgi:hypothetical protein
MINQKRNYTDGVVYRVGTEKLTTLYGKPTIQDNASNGKNVFTELFNGAYSDIELNTNPIIQKLIAVYGDIKAEDLLNIKKNIKNYVSKLNVMSNDVQTIINDICVMEQNTILDLKKIALINGGPGQGNPTPIDGKKLDTGLPLVYYLTVVDDNFNQLRLDISRIYLYYTNVDLLLKEKKIITDSYKTVGGFVLPEKSKLTNTPENKRFYMITSSVFKDENKVTEFNKYVLNTNFTADNKLRNKFEKIVKDLAKEYTNEYELENKIFTDFKSSKEYKDYTEGVVEKLYQSGVKRTLTYTTVPNTDQTIQTNSENRLKAVFSDKNSITDNRFFIQDEVKNVVKLN